MMYNDIVIGCLTCEGGYYLYYVVVNYEYHLCNCFMEINSIQFNSKGLRRKCQDGWSVYSATCVLPTAHLCLS